MNRRTLRPHGFTLIETLIAAMLAVGLGMVGWQVLRGGLFAFARNHSINQSGGQTRAAVSHVMRQLEKSVDDPQLVSFSGTAFADDTSTYGKGVRFHRQIAGQTSGGYKIQQGTGANDIVKGAGSTALHYLPDTITSLTLEYSTTAPQDTPAPQVGDRIFFLSPSTIGETVSGGTSPGYKPGRSITAVSVSGSTATVTLSSAPGLDSSSKPLQILANNPCYLAREAAYICVDSGTRRELRYYEKTSDLTKFTRVTWDLDKNPAEKDSTTGVTIQPFEVRMVGDKKRVVLDLPIRVMNFNAALARVKPTDEFNSYMRTYTHVMLKNRSKPIFAATPTPTATP